jgi:hypothetical protein
MGLTTLPEFAGTSGEAEGYSNKPSYFSLTGLDWPVIGRMTSPSKHGVSIKLQKELIFFRGRG